MESADRPAKARAGVRLSRRAALEGIGGGLVAAVAVPVALAPARAGAARSVAAVRPQLPIPRCRHTATVLPDGRVLIAGGYHTAVLSGVQIYDPATNSWFAAASMKNPREQHAAVLLPDGRVLVVGGYGTRPLASAEVYDPTGNIWSAAAPMRGPRFGHTAVLLPDGSVLVTGGSDQAPLSSSEVYIPATNSWQPR